MAYDRNHTTFVAVKTASAYAAADCFDEGQFAPPVSLQAEYEQRVRMGYQRMGERRVVIAGLARNLESILPLTIRRIERLGQLFGDYRVVIYENDSSDRTPELLRSWAGVNPRVQAVCETLTDPVNPPTRCLSRAARMAAYRSRCQQVVREHWPTFDHAMLVDMDVQGGWSQDGVAHTLSHDAWDFVGSYGVIYRRHLASPNALVHYDAWAFRDDEAFTPLSTKAVNHRLYHRGQPLQPVTSCFGGLGIYRMPVYLAGRYDGTDVEHVSFHRDLYRQGYRQLFLNPNQIVVYGRKHRTWDARLKPLLWMLERLQGKTRTEWRFDRDLPCVSLAPAASATARAA
jgi:hypothetical protein